ncbi:MAG: outer membrane beta-barrel protein [Methylobacter sp.]|nr:outer membrane beta-barrel protein [Methylobacter sp.]
MTKVAEALMIDLKTIRNHYKRYPKGGLASLLNYDTGSEATLKNKQLSQQLQQNISQAVKDIVHSVEQTWHISSEEFRSQLLYRLKFSEAVKTITLPGLLSRKALLGKNTGPGLTNGKDEAINNSFKSLLPIAVQIMVMLFLDSLQRGRKNNTTQNRYLLSCFMLLLAAAMPNKTYALASPDDTIRPYVASTLLYDSNFLRLSDSVDPVSVTGKSDTSEFVKQVAAGFDVDWTIGRQHIIVKGNVNQNWFQNFTTLDYTGWDTQAQWNWRIGNNLDGEIGYTNAQILGGFGQLNNLVGNLINNQRYFANAGYLFHPNGKIKFGLFRTEIEFDGTGRQFSNNTEDNAEANLQYLSPTGSSLGLRVIATDGQYPQRELTAVSTQDNAYTRMNYAMVWDWHSNSKTRIDGLVGYTQQDYANFGIRNFNDIVAELSLNWQASDKTLLALSARRQIAQADNLFSSFVLTQGVWFNLSWQSTPKIAIRLPMSYQEQDYLGGSGTSVAGFGFGQQKDKVGNIGFNVMYQPLESISIGPVLNYEKRDSNNPTSSYESKSAGVNLQADF